MGKKPEPQTKPAHLRDLTPDPKNARKHNPRNVGMLVDALQEVGAARSIVIDEEGVVLAGNATIEAAAEAGITKVVTVDADGETLVAVRRTGLTPEQKTRLALYDNCVAELADWNESVLTELREDGLLAGMFSDDELDTLLAQADEVAPGAGGDDLWQLGGHRLLCGDSTKAEGCFAIEISPKYCDVILRRWEAETGKTAVRLVPGEGSDEARRYERGASGDLEWRPMDETA